MANLVKSQNGNILKRNGNIFSNINGSNCCCGGGVTLVCDGCSTTYSISFDWELKYTDGHTSSNTYNGTVTWDGFYGAWILDCYLENDVNFRLYKYCESDVIEWVYSGGDSGGGVSNIGSRITGVPFCPPSSWPDSSYIAQDDLFHLIITNLSFS